MNASVRTVHLLDRTAGKATESREVAGIKIEKGVPLPRHACGRYSPLLDAIMAMEPGESLLASSDGKEQRYKARKRLGKDVAYCTEKEGLKWRIWRVK